MTGQLPANMRTKITLELCPVAGLDGFCWTWTGCLNSRGYGCVGVNGKSLLTHRVSYARLVGPIADGLQIDHLCANKRCCNPKHLEVVTAKVNCERTPQATKTMCAKGHRYTPENTIWRVRGGLRHRQCRMCQAQYQRDRRLRRRAERISA